MISDFAFKATAAATRHIITIYSVTEEVGNKHPTYVSQNKNARMFGQE